MVKYRNEQDPVLGYTIDCIKKESKRFMLENIISTKITSPKFHSRLLHRPRIKELLTGSYPQIWTIVAGPGYSKTTVLMELKESLQIPSAWYSPDDNDKDIYIFLKHLVQAIKLIDPSYCKKISNVLAEYSEYKNIDIKTLFINELAEIYNDIIIILDNYHKISDNKDIEEFIQFLTDYLPSNIYLAISSRQSLPFNFNKLANIGQVINLTTQDIKFNMDESVNLIEQRIKDLTLTKEISDILTFLDGWVFGLLLLIENLRRAGDKITFDMDYFQTLVHNRINEYFGSEIINYFSDSMMNFLLFTSIPDIFEHDICQSVLKISASEISEYIEKIPFIENYYIENKMFYKYHEVFRQFLLNELEKQYSQKRIKNIHKKLGNHYERKELYNSSIKHYLKACEYKDALKIIEKLLHILDIQPEFIGIWLPQFSDDLIETDPVLLTLQAFLEHERLNIDQAIYFYQQAEKKYLERDDYAGLIIVFMNLIRLFKLKSDEHEMKKYLDRAKKYEHRLPLVHRLRYLNNYASVISDEKEAIDALKKLLSISVSSDDISVTKIRIHSLPLLSRLYKSIGDLDNSIYYMEQFLGQTHSNSYRYLFKSQLLDVYLHKGQINSLLSGIEDILEWLENNDFIFPNRSLSLLANISQLLLKFNNERYINIAKGYLKKAENYISNLPFLATVTLKSIYAMLSFIENNFSHALTLYKEIFNETSNLNSNLFDECYLPYLHTLIMLSDYNEAIKSAEEHIEKKLCLNSYQKLKIQIFLCTAYLKAGITDKGGNLLKIIISECTISSNEALILIYPVVLETLIPFIYETDNSTAVKFYRKSLQIYNTEILPYTFENLLPLIPLSLLHDNPELINETEAILDKTLLLINILGSIDIKTGNYTVQWERQNLKKLFALLVLSPSGIGQYKLIEEMFPDEDKNVEHHLRTLIYYLRKALEPDIKNVKESNFVLYENEKYKLNISDQYCILDVKEFLKHHSYGLDALKNNKHDISYCEYKKAIAFYKGDLAEGITSYDLELLRENYKRKYIDMLIFLTNYSLGGNLSDECLTYCDAIIKADKYEENAYCSLMKYYSRKGRADLVKKQYQTYKTLMKKDLKSDVPDSVQKLYDELMKRYTGT